MFLCISLEAKIFVSEEVIDNLILEQTNWININVLETKDTESLKTKQNKQQQKKNPKFYEMLRMIWHDLTRVSMG